MISEHEEVAAAVLTLAHFIRIGPAEHTGEIKYAHDSVVEEYEQWLGYICGVGEPVSPHDYKNEEENDA